MATKQKYTKKEVVQRIPFRPSYPPSAEQEVIFEQVATTKDNLHIEASPGSGKSTTLVWTMTMDKTPRSAMVAFGKDIVLDIEPKCAPHVVVGTCHSFGRQAVATEFGNYLFLSQDKVRNIICKEYPALNPFEAKDNEKGKAFSRMNHFTNLVNMLRVNLTDETDTEAVMNIANQYNIEADDEMIPLLPNIFNKMIENPKVIDFTDMIWLPIRMDLNIKRFDMVYTDERQDFNTMMIEFVKRMSGGRIITVGDQNQSIMGWAGADLESTARLVAAFPGQELGLNTCYRCGTDIVELAATIYDKIKPFDKNPKGTIEYRDRLDMDMPEGSMILSRRNANLIKPCFELLKAGRKAIIKGEDIGASMISLINQMKAVDLNDLRSKIEEYRCARIEKLLDAKEVKVASIEAVNDTCDCLMVIADNCSSIEDIIRKIDQIFAQDTKGITLSSIHRSKGRESKMVSIIDYSRIRLNHDRMKAEDHIQEANLNFVAITRAIDKLHIIG